MHRVCKLLLCLRVAASACGEGAFETNASCVAWFARHILKFQVKARTVPWFLMLELFLLLKKQPCNGRHGFSAYSPFLLYCMR